MLALNLTVYKCVEVSYQYIVGRWLDYPWANYDSKMGDVRSIYAFRKIRHPGSICTSPGHFDHFAQSRRAVKTYPRRNIGE